MGKEIIDKYRQGPPLKFRRKRHVLATVGGVE